MSEATKLLSTEIDHREQIKLLRKALLLCDRYCEHLHHEKKHQHTIDEPCPVEALIEKALEISE